MKFHLFGKSLGHDFSHFNELLDFSNTCLPESSAMRNFHKVEFGDAISEKSTRLTFSDIHNPSLRFLHRWMSFTLFPMEELHSVATPELKCLFAMVNRIMYTPVANIVDYFKKYAQNVRTHQVYLHGHSDCYESWVSRNGQLGLH